MQHAEELQHFALFKSIPLSELEALSKVLRSVTVAPGTVLFNKDEPGDTMYLIRDGKVRIFIKDSDGNEITFRYYAKGSVIGEFSLLDGQPRSASADVNEPLVAWMLDRADFDMLLNERPLFGVELMRSLAERVRYTTSYLDKLYNAVTLLSNNDYERAMLEMGANAEQDEVQELINAFVDMANHLQMRDAVFKKVSARPKVEMDQAD
jgi:CRP-like cAMP-binding protein